MAVPVDSENSPRVVICGVPRAGKTTLAAAFSCAFSTDSLIDSLEWSEVSEHVSAMFDAPGPWAIEGVAAVRALRKWLAAHKGGKPCDMVMWFGKPAIDVTAKQAAMGKGVVTVWQEIVDELRSRGVLIHSVDKA